MTVYLCGPMEGLTQEQAAGWRKTATDFYTLFSITVKDPTRRKKFHDEPYSYNLAKRIVKLDLDDIASSSLLLVNLKDRGEGKAWGSLCELALGYQQGKTIITILEEGFNHPFVETFSTELHHNLSSALDASLAYYR
jgi:hypothetical protein